MTKSPAERLLLNAPAMAVAGMAEESTAKGTGDVDEDRILLPSVPCSLLSFDFTAAILALAVVPSPIKEVADVALVTLVKTEPVDDTKRVKIC